MVNSHPTPYPDVNEILTLLLDSVKDLLQKEFIGMYLYGSLVSGDFHSNASDIDFLVVTTDLLPENVIAELKAMHDSIWKTSLHWAEKLEGSYIPQEHLRRYEKTQIGYPTVNEGKFYVAPHGSDWIIQRYIVREGGVVLAGPDPKNLIDPIGPDDIRRAVLGILGEWWFPMLDDPSWLKNHGSEYYAYTILTMCRSLHALEHRVIVSKSAAARWAQGELGGKWLKVIEQSLATRTGARNFELYESALELIRYTMDRVSPLSEEVTVL